MKAIELVAETSGLLAKFFKFWARRPEVSATFLLLVSCGEKEQTSSALATVDGTPVTEETFRYWWEKEPPQEDTPETRKALLQRLIDRTSLAEKARAAGIDKDPAVIESIESLLIAALKEKELQPKIGSIAIAEEDTRAYYESKQSQAPKRFHPAVLWFNSRGQEPLAERYRQRLEKLLPTLANTTGDFGKLSVNQTEHRASRFRGGSFGWMTEGKQTNPVRNAVAEISATLKPGELSPVIVRKEGVFLVRLIERDHGSKRSFEDLRPSIEQKLLSQRRRQLRENFDRLFAAPGNVIIHHENLLKLSDLPIRKDETSRSFNPRTAQVQ